MPNNPSTPDPRTSSTPAPGQSVLAQGAKLSGDLRVSGLVELHGNVEGKLFADEVVIEEDGSVNGGVQADKVDIKGRLDGELLGGDVTLHSTADVSGTISYVTLTIESGAKVASACSRQKKG